MEKQYKLPKKFAEKWIKALKSGEYKQTTGTLIKVNKVTNEKYFCCLGVAASICGVKEKTLSKYYLESLIKKGNITITKNIGDLKTEEKFNAILVSMNDAGESFETIAGWIEQNVEFV